MSEYSPITIARFWSKVDVRKEITHCWMWRGAMSKNGYGRIKIGGENLTASRVAWELANEEPLGDRYALHHCDNPRCCNPEHIYAGTRDDNARDRVNANRSHRGYGPRRVKTGTRALHYREGVVARVKGGERVCDLSRELGIPYTTIDSWIRRSKRDHENHGRAPVSTQP